MPTISFHTRIGNLSLTECHDQITKLSWGSSREQHQTTLLISARAELLSYFAGELETFTIPLHPTGTDYQMKVWAQIQSIPHGETRTYSWLSTLTSSSPRAVGGACGQNPIPVLIPCHRVISKSGLGGYSGGGSTLTKLFLLRLEGTLV